MEKLCDCLSKHDKDVLTKSLNSSIIDAERVISESSRRGWPKSYMESDLESLIADYRSLRDKVQNTSIC